MSDVDTTPMIIELYYFLKLSYVSVCQCPCVRCPCLCMVTGERDNAAIMMEENSQ